MGETVGAQTADKQRTAASMNSEELSVCDLT